MHSTSFITTALLTAVAHAANHDVTVGSDLKFHPDSITGAKGDTVTFKIGKNHNVVQGDFSSPCSASSSGISSGEVYGGSGSFNSEFFVVTLNNTDPVYLFCGEPGHCQAGMVAAINAPTSGNTLSAYSDAAQKTSNSKSKDEVSGGVYANKAPSGSSSSSSSSSSSAPKSSGSSGSSSAAATTTASGSPSGTSAAAASSSSPGGAAGLEVNQGLATAAVMALAGVMSWFM